MSAASGDQTGLPLRLTRRGFVQSAVGAGFAAAVLPVQAGTVITTDTEGLVAGEIRIPVGALQLAGYRARPAGRSKPPIILVVQEIFGVHEHIKDVCRRFAKAGYLAIAPELYQRYGDPSSMADIQALLREVVAKVPDAEVMADLDAAAAWAVADGGDADRLGVTGFCWGGRTVWLYAAHNPKIRSAVVWYGRIVGNATPNTPRHPIDVAAQIKAPVLALYGTADAGIPVETVERMMAALKAAGNGASELVLYKDAPHAFHADYRPSYRKEAAEDSWRRALAWFGRHLG